MTLDSIRDEIYDIGLTLGFPGALAALNPTEAQYKIMDSPFVRDLATNKVLERIKQDLAVIDMQYPSLIDEIAKKKQKKRIKGRVEYVCSYKDQ